LFHNGGVTAGGQQMKKVVSYGERIRELREKKAWTQEDLTEFAGLESVRTVQRVEKNQTRSPETLRAIAGAFNVDVNAMRIERAVPVHGNVEHRLAHLQSWRGERRLLDQVDLSWNQHCEILG
jgi:transcriptional regulator with XRE-family HTH domain